MSLAGGLGRSGGRRLRIGDVLVQQGTISADQLQQALDAQSQLPPGQRKRLGAVVVEQGFATERQVASALAAAMNLDIANLRTDPPNPELVRELPQAVAQRCGVLLLSRTPNGLRIATSDPTNVLALDDIRLATGAQDLVVLVATESEIKEHLGRAWSLSAGSSEVTSYLQDLSTEIIEESTTVSADDAPMVKLVNQLLVDAVRARASDLHVQPEAHDVRVRYRVDGVLRDVMSVPRGAASGLVSRIKITAGLDIAERRVPQDGRTRLEVDGKSVDARVSTLPGLHGEKVVIRLLTQADSVPAVPDLGFADKQLTDVLGALAEPQGLVLITGPTGSGKTNTLYSAINHILTPETNIITLEDPVEISVPGITQVQINPKAGLTFAKGLRSVLRQDPDVVLVGEVRDQETAKLALEAAMTGHLVLTTLHTNNAPAALTRLVEMGVEPYLVASSLTLVAAQRLARRPCATCTEPYVPDPKVLQPLGLVPDDLAGSNVRKGRGCADCGGSGYRGRLGVFEVLAVNAAIRQVLLESATESAVSAAARRAGMLSLRGSALAAAHAGRTTFEEVLRVTTASDDDGVRCPSCRQGVAGDMMLCPWCETPLGQSHCSGCSRVLDPAWRRCPWCATPASGGHGAGMHLPLQPAGTGPSAP